MPDVSVWFCVCVCVCLCVSVSVFVCLCVRTMPVHALVMKSVLMRGVGMTPQRGKVRQNRPCTRRIISEFSHSHRSDASGHTEIL
jgi:hypothetical protein